MTSGQSNCSCSHLLFFSWKRARRHVTLYAVRTDKQLHSALYACVTHRLHLCSKSEDGGLAVGGIFSVTSVPSRDFSIPPPAPRDRCRYKETAARASRGGGGQTSAHTPGKKNKQTTHARVVCVLCHASTSFSPTARCTRGVTQDGGVRWGQKRSSACLCTTSLTRQRLCCASDQRSAASLARHCPPSSAALLTRQHPAPPSIAF